MQTALAEVETQLGRHHPLVIDGAHIDTPERIESINPSHKRQLVGTAGSGTEWHARAAVSSAREALPAWSALDVSVRADYLRRAAAEMRRRRCELAAWQVYECGKNWREADADVCEAIDFCEYYARTGVELQGPQAARLGEVELRQPVDVPGEENRTHYLPRGVAARGTFRWPFSPA
jgi:acyl-CoA reductase-like NAD-dependent aldehyde dehydrogenase